MNETDNSDKFPIQVDKCSFGSRGGFRALIVYSRLFFFFNFDSAFECL